MGKNRKELTIDREQLEELNTRLNKFMEGLPREQSDALAVILARAAAARQKGKVGKRVNQHLFAVGEQPGPPSLPMLASALDGVSNFKKIKGPWHYSIWTHHHS